MTIQLALAIVVAGVAVGVMSAMFGVGGGILMVPFMVLALSEPQHLAEGTSLLVIVPTAAVGVVVHRRRSYVSMRTAILLAIGGIAGAWLGAVVALRLAADTLQVGFGILMAVAGLRVLRKGIQRVREDRAASGTSEP